MSTSFREKIFILDLANNHFGDVKHALKTIEELSKRVIDLKQRVVLKVQLRDLDSYIHPDFKGRKDLHYIRRFSETRLEADGFKAIAEASKAAGFDTMATCFDEASFETFQNIGFDYVKIASASSNDLPLVSGAASLGVPLVASTGGLLETEIQALHGTLRRLSAHFAMMHCVSVYPAPDEILQLRQISNFLELFPGTPIGWSTHETPENMAPVQLAVALGATLFERHVGLESGDYKLNGYSSSPDLVRDWIESAMLAESMLGSKERLPITEQERTTLLSLKRGLYAKSQIEAEKDFDANNVFSAFPLEVGGVESGTIEFPAKTRNEVSKNSALSTQSLVRTEGNAAVSQILASVRAILARARVAINDDATLELSHHYGIGKFREFGVAMFTCVNRNYAKKILVMLPRQKHPLHFHDMKEETFQLLWGDAQITVNGRKHSLLPGELITVYPKEWHKFTTLNGCVIEEVSTHHSTGDSFYEDSAIASSNPNSRKTPVDNFEV